MVIIKEMQKENDENLELETIDESVDEDIYFKVHLRDAGMCQRPDCRAGGTEVHHKIFRSAGGKDEEQNLVLLCQEHHQEAHENQDWRLYWEQWQPKKYKDIIIDEY